jgi:hypothetical protein
MTNGESATAFEPAASANREHLREAANSAGETATTGGEPVTNNGEFASSPVNREHR